MLKELERQLAQLAPPLNVEWRVHDQQQSEGKALLDFSLYDAVIFMWRGDLRFEESEVADAARQAGGVMQFSSCSLVCRTAHLCSNLFLSVCLSIAPLNHPRFGVVLCLTSGHQANADVTRIERQRRIVAAGVGVKQLNRVASLFFEEVYQNGKSLLRWKQQEEVVHTLRDLSTAILDDRSCEYGSSEAEK